MIVFDENMHQRSIMDAVAWYCGRVISVTVLGAPMRGIAHHYGVSVEAVEMRLKFTGLWGLQQR
jgi:hypothetical protein